MKDNVLTKRLQKDQFLKNDARSPLPIWAKKRFKGLVYYDYKEEWLVDFTYRMRSDVAELEIANNFGGKETYIVLSDIFFAINNTEYSLQLFALKQNKQILWLPFKDLTNGTETYGAGRFLDIKAENFQSEVLKLDFNEAYNPYCAFNEKYSCPIIPLNNILNIRIEAGEKIPPKWT